MNEKLFEIATRKKYRFPFRGLISVEDLWDLTVENLDSVYKTLNAEMKQVKEESLLNKKTEDIVLENKIEIIKYIVAVKQKEKIDAFEAKEKKEKKQKIMAILADKENQELRDMSKEKLLAMLDEMD